MRATYGQMLVIYSSLVLILNRSVQIQIEISCYDSKRAFQLKILSVDGCVISGNIYYTYERIQHINNGLGRITARLSEIVNFSITEGGPRA